MDEKTPESSEEPLVARVRAADPAADAVPDVAALQAAVEARRAEGGARSDELAVRRARRWAGLPAKVAGIAAAALIVGAGSGYAVGAAGDGGAGVDLVSADAGGAAPPMALPNPGDGGDEESMAAGDVEMSAPSTVRGGDAMWWGGGRTVFTASGLSDEPTVLHGWGFDSSSAFTEQAAAAAAAALGVAGTPQSMDGAWVVGPNDGSGPSVQLYADGTVSLSYWDPAKDPWACAPVTLEEKSAPDAGTDDGGTSSSSSGGGDVAVPEPDPCEQRDLGPAPEGDAAAQVLSEVLVALGLDPASFEWQVDHAAESPEWTYVTAYQVHDGRRTGLAWSGTLTGAGLQSLYGSTAALVDLGEYPVISPADAVERLMDPRFGAGYAGPMYYDTAAAEMGTADEAMPAPVTTVPPTAGAGTSISWPVSTATIVEARLGLALHTQPDGSALLVPTYELVSDAGAVWTVIAVADDRLDFTPAG